MKTMFNLLFMAIICTMCVCCSNDVENIDSTNENLLNDPTRKVFASTEDFQNYCISLQNNDSEEINNTETIIDSFKALTKLEKLFNAKNEYQIGDTIYKIGNSGYTHYKIAKNSYLSAITLIENEKEIIHNLQSYNKINDVTYEITSGAFLIYTGRPIIEIKEIATNPQARTNTQYDTKVTVSFWVAHPSGTEITCGFKVSAIKESTGKAFNTNLTLEWKGVYVELGQSGAPSDTFERFYLTNSGVSKANSSSLSFTSFKRGSMYANSLNINLLSGTITGGAKAPNGKFVYATIKR